MSLIEKNMQTAVKKHQSGDLLAAEKKYRWVLKRAPNHPDAWHLLGLVCHQRQNNQKALEYLKKAVALVPNNPLFSFNLGNVAKQSGQLELARNSFQSAVQSDPNHAQAHANLANLLAESDEIDQAVVHYKKAIQLNPTDWVALNGQGLLYRQQGCYVEAADSFQRALSCNPASAEIVANLGFLMFVQGQYEQADEYCRRAIELNPSSGEAHHQLGVINLERGFVSEAIESFRRAKTCAPGFAKAHAGEASALRDFGDIDGSIAGYKRALELDGRDLSVFSGLLMSLNYTDRISREEVYRTHRQFEADVMPAKKPLNPDPDSGCSDRRLRVGYLSPDFRTHSCAYFMMPLLSGHDRSRVEIFCYSTTPRPDSITEQFKAHADHWLDALLLTKQQLANRIKQDGIDILVDLAGHTEGSWLEVFSYRPAPVQVSWLGYPNTTGLSAIDFRLVDDCSDPLPEAQTYACETLYPLAGGFLCFQPLAAMPEIKPVADRDERPITFGSFNNLNKVTDEVIHAWANILQRLEGSQLLLKAKLFHDNASQERIMQAFVARGIDPGRIACIATVASTAEHLSLYNKIDIALDTFPYNGTTTTCEALWMGVPVISLVGDRHAARVGLSLLTHAGLPELLADSVDQYVEQAISLAMDPSALLDYKHTLRERVSHSKLADVSGFAREMEQAFSDMICTKLNREN